MEVNRFTAFDVETATNESSSICQIGIVVYEDGEEFYHFQSKVQPPGNRYYWNNIRVHGIEPRQTLHSPTFGEIYPNIRHFFEGQNVVAHNIPFDKRCLAKTLQYYGLETPSFTSYCTYKLYRKKLSELATDYGISLQHHDALSDARACAELFTRWLKR